MKCLFLGGCADGEWLDVDPRRPELQVPQKHNWNDPPHAFLTHHSYRRETFVDGKNEYFIYVSGIQPGKMFETLCAGYKAAEPSTNLV